MARRRSGEVAGGLLRLKEKFVAWRKTRVVGQRIPDRLWNAAAKLAADYGVNQTAKVLSLDYYSLKRRVSQSTNTPSSTSFVEFPSIPLPPANECIIELEDGAGASMRMHVKGVELADIVSLGRGLWNGA